jgi:hypothetical protein
MLASTPSLERTLPFIVQPASSRICPAFSRLNSQEVFGEAIAAIPDRMLAVAGCPSP